VLGQPEATQSDPATVAENIYYGLSLFNETFGDNEKVREKSSRQNVPCCRRHCHHRRRRRYPLSSPSSLAIVVAAAVAVVAEVARENDGVASRDASPLAATRSRVLSGKRLENAYGGLAICRALAPCRARVNLSATTDGCRGMAGARQARLFMGNDSFLTSALSPRSYDLS